jgi:DNA-binding IclR family transcriptional regulator
MSVFLDKTADTPAFRILEYFIEARETDHGVAEIIESTEMARSTFYSAWPMLIKNKYVILKRTVGKTNLYALNERNPYVQSYLHIFDRAQREHFLTH